MDSPTLPSSNVELDRLFDVREGVVSAIDVQAALDKTCLEKIVADTNANIGETPKHRICVCQTARQEGGEQSAARWSLKRQLPVLATQFQGATVQTLLDCGSMLPLIAESTWKQLPNPPKFTADRLDAFGCNGSALQILGLAEGLFSFVKNDTPFMAQFYILEGASSDMIIPSTWFSAFKAKLDYNLLSLTYSLPTQAFLIDAHGVVVLTPEEQLSQEQGQGRHEPEGERGALGEEQVGMATQPECQDDQADSCSLAAQKRPVHLKIVRPNAKVCFTLKARPIWPNLVTLPNDAGYGFVRMNKKGSRQILTLINKSRSDVLVDLRQPLPPPHPQSTRTVSLALHSWKDPLCAATQREPHNPEQQESLDAWQSRQSAFDHASKSLKFLPISSPEISFLVPAQGAQYPFGAGSDPLSILYVYLLYTVGINLQYPRLTEAQLCELVRSLGRKLHLKVFHKIYTMYKSHKVQDMYVKLTNQIIYCVHLAFTRAESQTTSCKKSQQGPALRSRLKAIHTELVDSVHCWAALCFLNQLLVNKFYSETLKHPFFQKLTLPLSLEEAIRDANANTMANATANTNTNTTVCGQGNRSLVRQCRIGPPVPV